MSGLARVRVEAVIVVMGLVAALLGAASTPGEAQTRSVDEIDDEIDAVEGAITRLQREVGLSNTELAAARHDLAEITRRFEDARRDLALAEGQLELAAVALVDAEERRDVAARNLERAESLLAEAEQDLDAEQRRFEDQVVSAYKYGAAGRGEMWLTVVQSAETPSDVAAGLYQLQSVMDYQDRIVDRVEQGRQDRERLAAQAQQTRRKADAEEAYAEDALTLHADLTEQARRAAEILERERFNSEQVLSSMERSVGTQLSRLADFERRLNRLQEERRAAVRRLSAGGSILCPIDPVWFQNDWGYPRSGGRSHKGNDLFADKGQPIIAIADGEVRRVDRADHYRPGSSRGDLGGISVSYWVDSAEYWYWAHLDGIADGITPGATIQAGQLIGWVGNTGNAYSTPPHAHVGRYVDGRAVNPYPLLKGACG